MCTESLLNISDLQYRWSLYQKWCLWTWMLFNMSENSKFNEHHYNCKGIWKPTRPPSTGCSARHPLYASISPDLQENIWSHCPQSIRCTLHNDMHNTIAMQSKGCPMSLIGIGRDVWNIMIFTRVLKSQGSQGLWLIKSSWIYFVQSNQIETE